jgi:hypothetical protein
MRSYLLPAYSGDLSWPCHEYDTCPAASLGNSHHIIVTQDYQSWPLMPLSLLLYAQTVEKRGIGSDERLHRILLCTAGPYYCSDASTEHGKFHNRGYSLAGFAYVDDR